MKTSQRSRQWLLIAVLATVNPLHLAWPADGQTPTSVDCRYWTPGVPPPSTISSSREATTVPFPQDDVFRPLVADPKQPQFFLSYQRMRFRDVGRSINAGVVGAGETFGLWSRRSGACDGLQVSVHGGVFAQFNLDAPSSDLINTDYIVGIPATWRQGPFSARVRLYHQSSHLGDEFLLRNPSITRVNLSFEELDALLSYDLSWARVSWARIYGGGGYLFHREPDLDRSKLQWGIEFSPPDRPSPIFRRIIEDLRMVPIVGADFKSIEQLAWNVNTNIVAGLGWYHPGSSRRVRLLFNYYHGVNPYGQFFNQKIEMFGGGLYLTF